MTKRHKKGAITAPYQNNFVKYQIGYASMVTLTV